MKDHIIPGCTRGTRATDVNFGKMTIRYLYRLY